MNVVIDGKRRSVRTVTYDAGSNVVHLVEQRLLPHEFRIVPLASYRETARAIKEMVVRGAGAIGATAAYGLAQGARAFKGRDRKAFDAYVETVCNTLKNARPTAVDPLNALKQVREAMRESETVEEAQALAVAAAEEYAAENVRQCEAIGKHGGKLIKSGMTVLTHCNAGWLAFVDVGSATAPIYAAHAAGRKFQVFCDETRPRCQGSTLTAWELAQQAVPHRIIADNAAGYFMQHSEIDLVIVGSDRVLGRTGEIANKIGTYTKAVLAQRHRIPFYVAIPLSTIDWNLKCGSDIPIEERDQDEVLGAWGALHGTDGRKSAERAYVRIANPTSHALNPGFDVTPPELISGIITPAGIIKPGELWARRAELGG